MAAFTLESLPIQRFNPSRPQRFSALLRVETRDEHMALEVAFGSDARLEDVATYGRLLTTLRGFYAPLEDALAGVEGWADLTPPIDVSARRRTALIDQDLAQLGLPVPLENASTDALVSGSLASGIGCLYVLEGTALGGQIIARRARAKLGNQLPVAFFSSAGRGDLRADWRGLQDALDAAAESWGTVGTLETIVSARQTFTAMGEWLSSSGG